MKIRFLKNWCGEIEKKRLQEVWDISYSRWSEVNVEAVAEKGKTVDLQTYDGDTLLDVPVECFKIV